MKAYQRVLKNVSWMGLIIGVFFGLYTGIGALNRGMVDREARAMWCLGAGGRTVDIDYVTGCFALTKVPIDTKIFGRSEQVICAANPNQVWIRVLGGPSTCYTFERLVQENLE